MSRHATRPAALLPLILAAFAGAQQIGEGTEAYPELPTRFCTKAGGCVTKQTKIVAKAESHNMYWDGDKKKTCDSAFNTTSECAFNGDVTACTKKCFIEPMSNYSSIGVNTKGDALTMRLFMPNSNGTGYTRINPQVHLLAEDKQNYEMFKLVNQELTFDVDMSALTCGLNGALYFSEMDPSGSRSELNPAGAAHGTGYCDAQCFTHRSYINGVANLNKSGNCCNEMDIWEANKMATVFTPHTCSKPSSFLCNGDDECGKGPKGVCDKAGCGLNPYKYGSKEFYGEGKTVDTKRPFTVVTQFVHANRDQSDAAQAGPLKMIVRKYVQDGRVIANPPVVLPSTAMGSLDPKDNNTGAITQPFCDAINSTDFNRLGGVAGMGDSMARGMVLVFSIWNSITGDNMNWLDSGNAGPCAPDLGSPDKVLARDPNVSVTFSNIRWGELDTTCQGSGGNKA